MTYLPEAPAGQFVVSQNPGASGAYPAYPAGASLVPQSPVNPPRAVPPAVPPIVLPPGTNASRALSRPIAQPSRPVDVLTPGTILKGGRYRIVQPFASPAGIALAREPLLLIASDTELPNGRVLVQEIPLTQAHPEDAERARQSIAQRLMRAGNRSSGVPRLVDHFSERRRHFLVFELPTGDRLLDRMQRAHGPLPETALMGYAIQVLEVLQALERDSQPIIHGNITPANIILRPSGQAVLVGFSPILLAALDSRAPQPPTGQGNPYAAPEQLRGQADTRSDLFSLCAVMYHALTGHAPEMGNAAMYPPARRFNPNLSLELEEVLGTGLRPSPSQRFQSARGLRAVLEPLASGRHLTHVPDELLDDDNDASSWAPVRDARGRLVMPHRHATRSPLFLVSIVMLVVLLLGSGTFFAIRMHSGASTGAIATPTPDSQVALFQAKGIALSGGEFVFDSSGPNSAAKQRGARALTAGDITAALTAYNDAKGGDPDDTEGGDPSDPEAAIYYENMKVLASHQPYITVVAAVAYGADDDNDAGDAEDNDSARSELQGVAMAQYRTNDLNLLPGGLKVRVLILNSGENASDVTDAAGIVQSRIQSGNADHIVGIIGWPESEQTGLGVKALNASGLAIISPTASLDTLGGVGINFLQIVPTNSRQGIELADTAIEQLQAQRIFVVSDPKDATSTTLTNNFTAEVEKSQQAVITQHANMTIGTSTDFTAIADEAINTGSDLIFLAGDHHDAVYLAQALDSRSAFPPQILLPPQVDAPALLGQGDDEAAVAARKTPNALRLIDLATYADLGEWSHLGITPSPIVPQFDDLYGSTFGVNPAPGGFTNPDATTIMSYDAASMLLQATLKAVGSKGDLQGADPTKIRYNLLAYDANNPYMGFGGAISFTQTGHQAQKAMGILGITPIPDAADGDPVGQFSVIAVTGSKATFCGKSDCAPVWPAPQ